MAEMNGIAVAAVARPVPLPATALPDPWTAELWTAELVRLHQGELRQTERLVAASQATVALMDRLLDELRHLQQQVEALRLATQAMHRGAAGRPRPTGTDGRRPAPISPCPCPDLT
jgi:hypothetical protein